VVAEVADVLASRQAAQPEPGFVRGGDDDVSSSHAAQLVKRGSGVGQVLQHLEAEDQIEAVAGERKPVDAVLLDLDRRKTPAGEPHGGVAEVDRYHPRWQRSAEPRDRLSLSAAGVQQRLGPKRLHDREQAVVEAVDQVPDDRVGGMELRVVAALARLFDGGESTLRRSSRRAA